MSEEGTGNQKKSSGSFGSIFLHSDGIDKLLMGLGFIGSVGDGLSLPAVCLLMGDMINNISGASVIDSHKINKTAQKFCFVALMQAISCFLEGYCWTRTAERQASRMRSRYMKAVLRQEIGYYDLRVTSIAEVVANVSCDSLFIQDVISDKVPGFLTNLFTFIGSILVAFALLWKLAIVAFPFMIFHAILGLIYGRALMGIARKMKAEYNKAGTVALQALSSIKTVYAFVGESKTIENYSNALEGTVKLGLRQGLARGLAMGSNAITFGIWALTTYYGSRLVMYHNASGGHVFTVGISLNWGGIALGASLPNLKYFSEAFAAGERILELIKRVPEIDSDSMNGQVLENVLGDLEFKNVKFAYPSRPETPIFQNFNLKIPTGLTTALVGKSGSGKSTVIALLQRFYNPLGGEICLDGISIDKLQLKWLRSQMGLVSQEPALFATSIKENILFGKEDANMEEVIGAAIASNAHNFISQLPQGYDTQVGEGGLQMSGGQKQRIAIARALIKAPHILLLDEATSALDSESERVVQEALDNATVGRTTLIIAHRLSTIQNANVIAIVQNGQVMETGSHDELMNNENGLYASLVHLQQTQKNRREVTPNEDSTSSNNQKTNLSSNNCQGLPILSQSSSPNSSTLTQRLDDSSTVRADNEFPIPSFRRLLAMNLPEWRQALIACTTAVLFGTIQPLYSFALGSAISVFYLQDHSEVKYQIRIYVLCFVGLGILSLLINVIQHYCFAYMGEHLTRRIRVTMLSKILTFEVGWFDRNENTSGAVCSRLANDADVVRSLVGDRMALIIQTLSTSGIACTMGLIIAWRYALVLIAVQPLVIFCWYFKRVHLKNMSNKAMKSQEDCGKLASETVSNLRTVTAFSSQDRVLKMLKKAQEGPHRERIRQSWFAGIGLAISQAPMALIRALAFWYGAKLVSEGYIGSKAQIETFIILITTGRIIADLGAMTNDLAKGSNSIKSVFAVLDRFTCIEPNNLEGYKPDNITGHLELCDVQFAYPARLEVMVFNVFSINIEAGKSTALVGESGSGKSTIVGLILRFYDPLEGVVKIDGRDVRSYHLWSLRKHIALVSQEPTLFAGSIRDNITYGASNKIDEAEVIEATKVANAHDFIISLKDGYDTWCGNRGLQLSGGQKQRIAIARAILKNPAVLLLDEATSALDSQSERVVQDALDRVMLGRTSVVVAHNLNTIKNCDMIAVLDKGKVVEKGSHSSLLEKGPSGAYFSLVNLQRMPIPAQSQLCTF